MRRFTLVIILLIFSIFSTSVSAFIENRYEWWKLRHSDIKRQIDNVKLRTDINPAIYSMLREELSRADTVIKVFEKERSKKGSLQHEQRYISKDEIARATKKIAEPLVSVFFLNSLVRDAGSRETQQLTKETMEREIVKVQRKILGAATEKRTKLIYEININPRNIKTIALELYLGLNIKNRENLVKRYTRKITQKVFKQISSKKYKGSNYELERLIRKESIAYIESRGVSLNESYSSDALKSAWSWEIIENRVKHDLEAMKIIRTLSENSVKITYSSLLNLKNSPEVFESIIFRKERIRKIYSQKSPVEAIDGADDSLEIPEPVNGRGICSSITALRKKMMRGRNSKDKININEIYGRFVSLVYRDTDKAKDIYEVEHMRLKESKKESKDNKQKLIDYANIEHFIKGKRFFHKNRKGLLRYAHQSASFIRALALITPLSSQELMHAYDRRIKRIKAYGSFLSDVAFISSQAVIDSSYLHRRYNESIRLLGNFFSGLSNSLGLERGARAALDVRHLRQIVSKRRNTVKNLTEERRKITNFYRKYISRKRSIRAKEVHIDQRFKRMIGQLDMDMLRKSLEAHARVFKSMHYVQETLDLYARQYRHINKNLKKSGSGTHVENIILKGSLLSFITNFDEDKFVQERTTRKYLKSEGLRAYSRLYTLMTLYKRKNIFIGDRPDLQVILKMKSEFQKQPQIEVADWRMNEFNYREIDKKIHAKLVHIMHRKNRLNLNNSNIEEVVPVSVRTLNGDSLVLNISRHWSKQHISSLGRHNGVMAHYLSRDRKARIRIIQKALGDKSLAETVTSFITGKGSRIVKQKWGIGTRDYFWILSRAVDNNIHEVYAFQYGSRAVIISGRCKRVVYRSFKKRFEKLALSIKSGPHPVAAQ